MNTIFCQFCKCIVTDENTGHLCSKDIILFSRFLPSWFSNPYQLKNTRIEIIPENINSFELIAHPIS